MVALVAAFMGFGGGVNVQVGTAVDAQSVARFHMAGLISVLAPEDSAASCCATTLLPCWRESLSVVVRS